MAGALLGFLRYNFNPASIFLGDSGSLTIGFMLGCFGVIWGTKSATLLGMTAPLITLAIPLLDTISFKQPGQPSLNSFPVTPQAEQGNDHERRNP
ncbi:MAG TPA: hypothetical protein VMW38_23280 [Terriglobia bacterium]|nr:hypothetical protein [Terriglobia bacterium]